MTAAAKHFRVPGGPTLAYDDAGDPGTTPAVLLHGGGSGRRDWDMFGIAAKLATEHRVLALDQRGHGDSDRTPGAYRLTHYAADLLAFLDGVVGERAALVGHSLGGMVAAQVAGTRPDLVRCVFFEDPPLPFTPRGWARLRESAQGAQYRLVEQVLRSHHERGGSAEDLAATMAPLLEARGLPPEFAAVVHRVDPNIFTRMFEADYLDGYDRDRPIPCPVHLLRADPDRGPSFPPKHEARFLATHPRATVEVTYGCGHGIHQE